MSTLLRNRLPSGRSRATAALCALVWLGACHERPRWLEVERVEVGIGPQVAGRPGRVLLNQDLVVRFAEAVDPLSVTSDSVRVLDAQGHPVRGRLRCGDRSIRFTPVPPVTPSLDDGSFHLGERYELQIIGWPTSYAVRSRRGRPLERSLAIPFEVPADPSELGFETPFVPVGVGDEPFTLDLSDGRPLKIAADDPVLDLHFTLPPRPDSVRPGSFAFLDLALGSDSTRELVPESVQVLPGRREWGRHHGSTVRVRFPAAAGIEAGDDIYLVFREDADRALRDYRDRSITPPAAPLKLVVEPGDRIRLTDFRISGLELQTMDQVALGFELVDGRVVPRARIEAGDGRDGVLRPRGPMTLTGAPAGTPQARTLQLTRLEVPAGIELRIVAGAGMRVLVTGDVRIEGRLVLEGTGRPIPWRSGERPDLEALLDSSGFALVAAGRIGIAAGGRIETATGMDPDLSPCTLVSAAGIQLGDGAPPRCVVATEEAAEVTGRAASLIRLGVRLTPGVPAGARLEAGSWSGWIALPPRLTGRIEVLLDEADPGVLGWLQAAPPSAVGASVPQVEPHLLTPPIALPLREALDVRDGAFLRIGFTATVEPGRLPSVAGFRIYERE